VFEKLLAFANALVLQRLEVDRGAAQELLGNVDIAKRLVQKDAVRLLHGIEVGAQMVLFKLLLEPLEIAERRMKACQNPGQHGDAFRMRRSPGRHAAAPPGGCSGSTRRGWPDRSRTEEPTDSARMKARRIRQRFRPATSTGGPECGPGGCPTRRR